MASTSRYNQTSSPSTSTSPPTLWDVFLSFRGTDTRYTFTDHLYKALHRTSIRTFKDNPELRSGEVITDSLIEAIQESRTYIVVFSENYASSSWCLDELVEILGCHRQNKRLVVPVFYHVDPSVVRHQNGSFKEAFGKHQTRFDVDKVNKWRRTLHEVADFSGYHVSKNWSEADIVDEVVGRVLLEINPIPLNVAQFPAGLDSRIKGVTALFNSGTEGVTRIGIHGMGGVGKTTLAKAVYNQNYQRFEGSCYLANVREALTTGKGLVGLQQQLINDALKCKNIIVDNVDQGIELIRARIRSKKVLIVFDDLDDPKPLEFLEVKFALGSMILVTTRNEDLLDSINVQARYKANELDDEDSCQLFAQHAFRENKVPDTFADLSKEILRRAGGLPLALKVFGSNLFNQPEEEWRWFIDKLSRVPIDDIEKKLLISFDALRSKDPNLQELFLDIACFYVGEPKDCLVEELATYYKFVDRNIDYLIKRCLLTIDDYKKLGMHDLLRDMGRTIACNSSPDEPEKHSRLWRTKDIESVLKEHKGTEAIKGIICERVFFKCTEDLSFATETFKRMSKLRFLHLTRVNLTGSFEHTFEDLRWFRWDHCPLKCFPSEFYAPKLVSLDLYQSKLITMRDLNKVFENLKTLSMYASHHLCTTPDFTKLPCLETLNLGGCSSLEEVHISIGSLVRLVSLYLGGCSNLRRLPDSICSLRALKVLIVDGCSRLEALPTDLGRLTKLVELCLSHNFNLEALPDSICDLESLEILDISVCEKLEELPEQSGKMASLRKLNVKRACMLKMLPDISRLSNIECLDLSDCGNLLSIAQLPFNLKGIMAKNCTSIDTLPDLSNLKELQTMDFSYCRALAEIQGLEELTSLVYLNLPCCRSLERLPNLSNLKHLERLNLSYCEQLTEIAGLEKLSSLKYLDLFDCSSLERLPNLSNLKHLEGLDLSFCGQLTEIAGLEKLSSLKNLDLPCCRSLERLPNLSNLKHLERLNLSSCGQLTEIAGLEKLSSLKYLDLFDCSSLERLPNLSNLKHLERLDLSSCGQLTEIAGLEKLSSLELLSLADCRSIERLPNLSNLKQLQQLNLKHCYKLKEIIGLEEITSLTTLDFRGCNLPYTLTHRFFQTLSGFGHKIVLHIEQAKFPDFVNQDSSGGWSTMSSDLRPHESHNFLAIILALDEYCYKFKYSVKNITSGFIWSDSLINCFYCGSMIVIIPNSILSIGDGDGRIEITSEGKLIKGIHLLYKTDMIDEYDSISVNADDERTHPSEGL